MNNFTNLKVFGGRSHPELVSEICRKLSIEPGRVSFTDFSNDNIKVKIAETVRGGDVFVVQTSCLPVNEGLVELLIMIDALKYASADRITAVLPYYPYVRSDKKDEPRISITARLVADLLEAAGANRILTMKLHSPQIMGFSRIPMDQLLATSIICDYFARKNLADFVVVAPDVGRAKEAETYASRLDLPMAILDKKREKGDVEAVRAMKLIGDVRGKNVLIFDDEVLSGGTILKGAAKLMEEGAKRILLGVTHGVLSGDAPQRIEDSLIEELVITNTLPLLPEKAVSKITVLSVAKIFADAIMAIHTGGSVGRLFEGVREVYAIE